MIHLVTFSASNMTKAAGLCVSSAEAHGVDRSMWITWEMFQHTPTYKENPGVFTQPRGYGFWAWKPYVLREAMLFCKDGDILIYADAGVKFIDNVNHIIERMDQDIFLFGNEWQHAHWCKRDIVDVVWPTSACPDCSGPYGSQRFGWCDTCQGKRVTSTAWSQFGKQVQASVIFFRVNDKTRAFVKEWLEWCLFEGGRLADDSPSRLPNHPEFRENRYDQAILTTMAYRDGIKLHGWFVRYETYEPARAHYPDDDYPTLFLHHRLRNSEWGEHAVS